MHERCSISKHGFQDLEEKNHQVVQAALTQGADQQEEGAHAVHGGKREGADLHATTRQAISSELSKPVASGEMFSHDTKPEAGMGMIAFRCEQEQLPYRQARPWTGMGRKEKTSSR